LREFIDGWFSKLDGIIGISISFLQVKQQRNNKLGI